MCTQSKSGSSGGFLMDTQQNCDDEVEWNLSEALSFLPNISKNRM